MKKQILIKIISKVIIFSFAVFFLQTFLPLQASAAALNWDNPNKNGNNPYKFKPQDVLNSQLIMQVVGCTGVVDKVSAAVVGFVQGKAGAAAAKALKDKTTDEIVKKAIAACQASKKGAMSGAATIPNLSLTDVVNMTDCKPITKTADGKTLNELITTRQAEAASKTREECFNGIAVTLAKNQLTAMTRYTMNWVNTGFSGNPMYVQDAISLSNNIEKDTLENGINTLIDPDNAYPYGNYFSKSMINTYYGGANANYGAMNLLGNMTSTLGSFITDPTSYKDTKTLTPAEKAKRANDRFANDFATGGWNGWLGLTQNEKNNPLGFSMKVSQILTDAATQKQQATKDEVTQNNGFLSQKKCTSWQWNDKDGKPIKEKGAAVGNLMAMDTYVIKPDRSTTVPNTDVCVSYEVVTPGSLIKDKISTYVNSPERQLELAKTINDSLNSLFTALISKFQNQGLSSISSEKYQYTNTGDGMSGLGMDNIDMSSDGKGAGYSNGSFDLTHDLGNQFIHGYKKDKIGDWNAKTNTPKLSVNLAPVMADGTPWGPNVYYLVKGAGKTKLFENGYNNWEEGDRAFWNGTEWQNWKKTTVDKNTGVIINTNPIEKRGVIQIQKDFVVAAKELLMNLPGIMPKIGELDYCIPGPNPMWNIGSSETSTLFSDYANSITAEFKKGKLFRRKSNTYSIAKAGDPEYDDYYNVFKDTSYKWWENVTKTDYWNRLLAYGNMGTVKGSAAKLDRIQKGIDDYLEKIGTDTKVFNDVYNTYIEKVYGATSPMQTEFLQREDIPDLIPNPVWLPMASEGLAITKNIVAYNDDIITTADGYKDAIIDANSNVSKLNQIKSEVSAIIKAAQTRRDAKLLKILNDDAVANKTAVLTEAQYREKYKSCLKEEEIVYYDDLSIMGTATSEKDRCNDGLDNDLNGLIDERDPACSNFKPYVAPNNYACVNDFSEDGTGETFMQDDTNNETIPDDTDPCTQRTAGNCTTNLYYSGGLGLKCKLAGN